MSDDLDKLLATPLPEPADNGFSDRVLVRLLDEELRRRRRETVLLTLGVAAISCAMPFTSVGQAINHWAIDLGGIVAVPLALAGLAVLAANGLRRLLAE
jgi:hypothetical protein